MPVSFYRLSMNLFISRTNKLHTVVHHLVVVAQVFQIGISFPAVSINESSYRSYNVRRKRMNLFTNLSWHTSESSCWELLCPSCCWDTEREMIPLNKVISVKYSNKLTLLWSRQTPPRIHIWFLSLPRLYFLLPNMDSSKNYPLINHCLFNHLYQSQPHRKVHQSVWNFCPYSSLKIGNPAFNWFTRIPSHLLLF